MSKFWKHVLNLAFRKIREDWRAKRGLDLKCPVCNLWASECGGVNFFPTPVTVPKKEWEAGAKPQDAEYPFEVTQCKNCRQKTYWITEAGFWFVGSHEMQPPLVRYPATQRPKPKPNDPTPAVQNLRTALQPVPVR